MIYTLDHATAGQLPTVYGDRSFSSGRLCEYMGLKHLFYFNYREFLVPKI